MADKKSVLVIGQIPELVDYSQFPGMSAESVRAGIANALRELGDLGYAAECVYLDRGETAEAVLRAKLAERAFDCVEVGAGVRVAPDNFLLFEKLVNVIHEAAPGAKICFNKNPADTVAAVRRWV